MIKDAITWAVKAMVGSCLPSCYSHCIGRCNRNLLISSDAQPLKRFRQHSVRTAFLFLASIKKTGWLTIKAGQPDMF